MRKQSKCDNCVCKKYCVVSGELKSKKKIICLSCIEGSKVLCEFWNQSETRLPKPTLGFLCGKENNLYGINTGLYDIPDVYEYFSSCMIKENHWISNHDGKLVLPDGLLVDVQYRDGTKATNVTHRLMFDKTTASMKDPIAVKVTGTDYLSSYEWESE